MDMDESEERYELQRRYELQEKIAKKIATLNHVIECLKAQEMPTREYEKKLARLEGKLARLEGNPAPLEGVPPPSKKRRAKDDTTRRKFAKKDELPGAPQCEGTKVWCGNLEGAMTIEDQIVSITFTKDDVTKCDVSPSDFEAAAGKESAKKWKQTIKIVNDDGKRIPLMTWAKSR